MFKLSAKITIFSSRKWLFDKISSCEIERDIKNLTATALIKLPKKIKWQDENEIPVKTGDGIIIKLGYEENGLETVFQGYIKSVGIRTPIEIRCEDEMFALKQMKASPASYRNATISQIIKDQLGEKYSLKVISDATFSQAIRIKDTSVTIARLLEQLKEKYKCYFFFKDNYSGTVLCSALLSDTDSDRVQVFDNCSNMIKYDNLKVKTADEIKAKIKAVSISTKKGGEKIEVEVGDPDGETIIIVKKNQTIETLKKIANIKLKEIKVDGLDGSFETFGAKICGLLDTIKIVIDGKNQGRYRVLKNVVKYDHSGYRQTITIGGKVS